MVNTRKEDGEARHILVLLPGELIARIDDFRFANRMASRAETIRTLIEIALGRKPPAGAAAPRDRRKVR